MVRLLRCSACRTKVSEAAPSCPSCGHPLGQDPKFQAARRRPRTGAVLAGVLLLAMGLGALVKPPPPTPGPPSTAKAAPAPAQAPQKPQQPAQPAKAKATSPPAAAAPGFANPSKIAACLAPLGFKTGQLQKVPGGMWQAVSAKSLFHGDYGDVNLFVSGPSARTATTVELEANARADRWPVARAELLRALPLLMEHLRLPTSAELLQAIEADTGEQASDAEFTVGNVKVRYSTRPTDGSRSARVSMTRK